MRGVGLVLGILCLSVGLTLALVFGDFLVLVGGAASFALFVTATALGVFD
ncbi:MAG: hypothetical protein Q7T33_06070 [Dehalococcoidia bacterium]|nr:hypothetical protein [Dehalococcoidia bacterium]